MPQSLRTALADVRAGLAMHRVWLALAQEDIGDQHRRTTLGPLWLLVNYLCFAGTFIFVFHRGASPIHNYPAYVAPGLLVWFYMMEVINNGIALFVREEGFIKGTTLPLTVYVMRMTMQSMIRTGYALLGCVFVLWASGIMMTPLWLWSALVLLVIALITPAVVTVFAFLGAFFPDCQYIVTNVMRVGMFLTPVFWVYDHAGGIQHLFYYWNPFTYFLAIVREPIVSGTMPAEPLLVCAAIGLAFWALALVLLGRFRRDVAFLL
jgi:lipopolysaccharide transport system permease protein